MKKLFMLAGLAAAAYGAMKIFRNKENLDDFSVDRAYDPYAAQPQV